MRNKDIDRCIHYLEEIIILDEPIRKKKAKIRWVIESLKINREINNRKGYAIKIRN